MELILAAAAGALAENLALDRGLGIGPLLVGSRRLLVAWWLAIATFVTSLAGLAVVLAVDRVVLQPAGLAHYRLLVVMFVVASMVELLAPVLAARAPQWSERIDALAPWVAINSAVVGCLVSVLAHPDTAARALAFGVGLAAGYGGALLSIAAARERLEHVTAPPTLRGLPLVLITLGLLSLGLSGLAGRGG